MENYFVITTIDGEQFESVKNTRELAEHWQSNDDAGYCDDIVAYAYRNGEMVKVNVYEIATEYLNEREEIHREYEDYCETVNEYGYDYYEDQDQLEMGFNPYMGCYDDDC